MKTRNRALSLVLAGALALGGIAAFAGCERKPDSGSTNTDKFNYATEMLSTMKDPDKDYNRSLFYVNSLDFAIADPSVIFITKGKDKGYFYAYGTSDDIGCHGVQAWRSKDLANWECTGVAYQPDYNNTWAVNNYWAPEVIYDEEAELYYMFYNAFNILDHNRLCLSVAYSPTPDGPFLTPTGQDENGKVYSATKPMYDVTVNNPVLKELAQGKGAQFLKENALDASPFIDPDTKEKYLYFSYYDDYGEGSFIYGMKMKDWYTPDYTTLTRLTYPGYSTVAKGESDDRLSDRSEGGVNEGPFMVKHDGKYYMTFSVFGYMDPNYRVIQAISDSPLGVYEKIDPDKGGKVISTDTVNWEHITSAGHHSFIQAGDELFIAYHTFRNRTDITEGRALAIDRVEWVEGADGVDLLHTNGPTYSVQPLPAAVSGYKNIAPSANVTATNTADYSDVSLLTDGILKYQERDLAEEYYANEGTSVITLSWESFKTARGLMIYNSWDYDTAFSQIKKVEMEYLKADGTSAWITMNNLKFDWDWFFDDEEGFLKPGGAAVAEFAELAVKTIKITVDTPADQDEIGIGEIVVLGKDSACAGVSAFSAYSYQNGVAPTPVIVRDSVNFGNIIVDGKESKLKTQWGYDVSHDDGTANAYITQSGNGDQYAYFKDVYSTSVYIEATFTVTSDNSYIADLGSTYPQGDPYPKFGIAISCHDSDGGQEKKNTIFYYVDANSTYTNARLGIAQRTMSDSDWDWAATEKSYTQDGIQYKNGNTVTLAVIRKGHDFWLLCNGKLVEKYSQFHTFTDDQRSGVGFLSFNTPMKITNYFATADASYIESKIAEYNY